MSHPTTRRYPRTLAQAFPRDYAAAIEHHRAHRFGTVGYAVACIGACVLIGLLIGAAL